jgi:hypothetical protein
MRSTIRQRLRSSARRKWAINVLSNMYPSKFRQCGMTKTINSQVSSAVRILSKKERFR